MHQGSTAPATFASTRDAVHAESGALAPCLGPGDDDLKGTFAEAKARAIERFERVYLEALLRRCRGNLSAASRRSNLSRHHLRSLLKKVGLYDERPGRRTPTEPAHEHPRK